MLSLSRRTIGRSRIVLRRLAQGALVACGLAVVSACDSHGNPTGGGSDVPVRMSFGASINAAPGAIVEGIVSFTPAGGSAVEVGHDSLSVDTGASNTALVLTADLSACFLAANGGDCVLSVTVQLKRNGAILDALTRTVTVAPGSTEVSVATMALYEVASVRITPSSVTGLEPGDSVGLAATALDRAGATVPARSVAWSTVGNAATVSSTGMLRAVAPGAATVRAAIGGRTLDLALTVGPPTVGLLTLAPADTAVLLGGSFPYRLSVRSSNDAPLTGRTVSYASLQPSIASINAAGVVTALAPGTATIRVTSNEGRNGATITATTTLRVNPVTLAANPSSINFDTEINQPLPVAQVVAISSPTGGNAGTLSLVTPIDTLLTASLTGTTAPTSLIIQPSQALAPGTVLSRSVVVRSSNANVAPITVTVNLTGRTPTATGRFSGVVVAAPSLTPLGQASVTIRTLANVQVAQAITAGNGTWTSAPIPAGVYNLTVSNPGFQDAQLFGQLLVGGINAPVTTLATVALTSIGAGVGGIQGAVRDATTGDALQNATVELRAGANNTSGAPLATDITTSDGSYQFPSRTAGTYTIRAQLANFADGNVFTVVAGADVMAPDIFLSPAGQNVAWRFVLSWGSTPLDLDAYLSGPVLNSASRFTVFFGIPGSLVASPFARLDIDEQNGFGPETITMSQQIAGVYRYYVNNFSAETPLKSSGARVDVYQGNSLIRQYYPPQQDGLYWTVFELNGTSITDIGTIGNAQPPIQSLNIGPRRNLVPGVEQVGGVWRKKQR